MEKELLVTDAVETGVEVTKGLNLAKVGKLGLVVVGGLVLVLGVPKIIKKVRNKKAKNITNVEETVEDAE